MAWGWLRSLSPVRNTSQSTMALDGVTRADVNRVAERTRARVLPDGTLRFAEYRVDRRPRSVTGVPTYCDVNIRETAAGLSIDATYRESFYGAGWPYLYLSISVTFGLLAILSLGPPIAFGFLAGIALFSGVSFLVGRGRRFAAEAAELDAQLRQLFTTEAGSAAHTD